MEQIKVAVSPHYRGSGWTDRGTGIEFKNQGPRLKSQVIELKEGLDLSGIKNSVRLNHLLLLEGEFPKDTPDEPKKVNPEELNGNQLDQLLARGGNASDDELAKENEQLKDEIKTLKEEIKSLKADTNEEVSEASEDEFKRNKDGSVSKSFLNDNYTKAELLDIAKDKSIEHAKNINKGDLVDVLAKAL